MVMLLKGMQSHRFSFCHHLPLADVNNTFLQLFRRFGHAEHYHEKTGIFGPLCNRPGGFDIKAFGVVNNEE
jgi:hypothetical protein